jgi:CDP-4-dehydro-6-deoxyglucose reductase
MALQPWRTGKVIKIENETSSTKRFWISVPELSSFDFKPGQFVTLDLPIHEKPNKRWRSYSISSWPDGTNVFELVIVLLEDGAGTPYLFNEVTVGTELKLRGPQGVFCLPEKIETDLFFICTGTGIAPFRSMVHHIIRNRLSHQHIYLISGCRKFADALYFNELKALEMEANSFHYLPVFSREPADGPHGHLLTGYVHGVYEDICLQHKERFGQPGAASFYLCGWKNMVDDAKDRILALGFEKKAIHLELYG